ncbi:MAG: hypothetical protein KBD76_10950 [Bacteriovorax sp.]|nr:hypothetical protein [Bacteriovorax sp.]
MRITFFILIHLVISGLNAQECGQLIEGEEIRLDASGKSLEKSRVQDQDGLNTCYANTASVMLQSALEGNPDISYLHIALAHADKVTSQLQGSTFAFQGNKKLLLDFGNTCDAINAARDIGGVCKRKDVYLEKLLLNNNLGYLSDPKNIQQQIFTVLSDYLDLIHENFNSQEQPLNSKEKQTIINEMRKTIEKNMPKYSFQNCKKEDPSNALMAMTNLIILAFNEKYSKSRNDLYPLTSAYINGRTGDIMGLDTKTLEKEYFSILKGIPAPTSATNALLSAIEKLNIANLSRESLLEGLKRIDPNVIEKLEEDYQRYVLNDFSVCSKQNDYVTNFDGFLTDLRLNTCLSSNLRGVIWDPIDKLINLKESKLDLPKLIDFILNSPELSYINTMTLAVAPDCTEDKKIKIPKNLKCNNEKIKFTDKELVPDSSDEKLRIDKEALKLRETTLQSMQNNRAVGLGVCQDFLIKGLDHNSFKRHEDGVQVVCDRGMHAVTIIGLRCKKNKIDYLIQNSNGEWRDLNTDKFERDVKVGKAWIDENEIIKNTTYYSHFD